MPFLASCPYCARKVRAGDHQLGWSWACRGCGSSFSLAPNLPVWHAAPAGGTVGAVRQQPQQVLTEAGPPAVPAVFSPTVANAPAEGPGPGWVSWWGLSAASLASLAVLFVSVPRWRLPALALATLGLAVVLFGLLATLEGRKASDCVWLTLGGIANAAVLFLVLVAPEIFNGLWVIDTAVPRTDPDQQVLMARDQSREDRVLVDGQWADAADDAIRQDDLLLRVQSVQVGPQPEDRAKRPAARFLLVHLRLLNVGHERTIQLAGFAEDTHRPTLTDDRGRPLAFLEQRYRKPARGPAVFETGPRPGSVPLVPTGHVDALLIFEAPLTPAGALQLELPAAAWGGKGVCRVRITRFFEAVPPTTRAREGKP
jgi:hypothetical protein